MRKQIISFLLIFGCFSAFVSSQDIASSIKNNKLSKSDIISRGRNLLLDSYVSGDIDKVNEAYIYLNDKVADENFAVFNSFEQIYLGALTKNYAYSLHEILRIDSISKLSPSIRRKKPVMPITELLSQKLADNSFVYLHKIIKNIDKSTLTGEDKKMLILILNDIFSDNYQINTPEVKAKIQNGINLKCDSFLVAYPHSRYEHYVRNYIRLVVGPSYWGFGMDFSLGYANAGLKSESIVDGYVVGIGCDFHHKKLGLFTRVNIIGTTTRKNFYFTPSAILPAGSSVTYLNPELSLGYETLNNKTVTLMPFAGIGGFFCDPLQNDQNKIPELKDKDLSSFSYQVGLNCDFKFKTIRANPYLINEYSFQCIRLRLTYLMPATNTPELKGNQLMVTVGWGLLGYAKRRTI
jgi:hypothetical protein